MRPRPFAGAVARFRNLRLFPKLLIPFLVLILVIGVAGAFSTVRFLSARAEQQLDQDLVQKSLDLKVLVQDRALFLLESVRFGANIQGVAEAVEAGDGRQALELMFSVLAVKGDLNLLVATDRRGTGLVEIEKEGELADPTAGSGGRWAPFPLVADVLRGVVDEVGDKRIGFLQVDGKSMLVVAGPIRTTERVVGAMIAGLDTDSIAAEARQGIGAAVTVYDDEGRLIFTSAEPGRVPPPRTLRDAEPVRVTQKLGGEDVATLYGPFEIRRQRAGTLAISLRAAPAFAAVRGAGLRLAMILLVAMISVVGIGLLLSRSILRQVKPLVATNRALGQGDLSARARVLGQDELGELARGFNLMAEQLQASYEELEMRVAMRTEELQRLYQEVVKSSEARSAFFAGVSHEFRTPLFAIIGNADLMLEVGVDPADEGWKEFPETIKSQGEHMLGLVNEILDLAKFESGRMELELEDTPLPEVVQELKGTIVPLARKSELEVDFHIPADVPHVQADRTRLRQIILNLASNAIKYTPPGGKVRFFAGQKDGMIAVSVADTGVGIPPEAADNLFEPFYQVKGTKAQKGQASTGLGLALTKRLVEAHAGTIWFDPADPAPGTVFTFTLHPVEAVAGDGQKRKNRKIETAPNGQGGEPKSKRRNKASVKVPT